MSVENNKTQDLYRWVVKAEHDLITATFTLKITDDCPCDTICFHAQQCAEKYLKGLLFWLDIDFPKTHDLRILIQLLPRPVSKLLDTNDVFTLNRYAIEARYPGDWESVTLGEAKLAIATARRVRRLIRQHLPKAVLQKRKSTS